MEGGDLLVECPGGVVIGSKESCSSPVDGSRISRQGVERRDVVEEFQEDCC